MHVCRSVWLVCACVSVGLHCVCMCVGQSALCVHVCGPVCIVCACVWAGLPCVCMCVGRSALCVGRFALCRVGMDFRQSNFQTVPQLKKDMFFPDRLVERSIIFQTAETIKHPFSHGTFQSHGYGFTSHLFHVVVKNRAK